MLSALWTYRGFYIGKTLEQKHVHATSLGKTMAFEKAC